MDSRVGSGSHCNCEYLDSYPAPRQGEKMGFSGSFGRIDIDSMYLALVALFARESNFVGRELCFLSTGATLGFLTAFPGKETPSLN